MSALNGIDDTPDQFVFATRRLHGRRAHTVIHISRVGPGVLCDVLRGAGTGVFGTWENTRGRTPTDVAEDLAKYARKDRHGNPWVTYEPCHACAALQHPNEAP